MKDIVIKIGEDLPTVGRMRFPDIDEVEIDPVFVVFVNLFHAPGMFTKRGSRIRFENQRDRFPEALRELEHFARSLAIRG